MIFTRDGRVGEKYAALGREADLVCPAVEPIPTKNLVTGEPNITFTRQDINELIKTDDGECVWYHHEMTTVAATDVDYGANTDRVIEVESYRRAPALWKKYCNGMSGGLGSPPLVEVDDLAQADL